MKNYLALGVLALAVTAQAANPTFNSFDTGFFDSSAANNSISNIWRVFGTNVLIVDSATGNDTLAALAPYKKTWQTIYNITSTNQAAHGAFGAATAAQPGDWIVVLGNPQAPYLVPSVPLNLTGNGQGGGVNFMLMPGATLVHTNFSNSDVTGTYHANIANSGPMIIPGNNSKVILLGTTICTNDFSQGDASIGFFTGSKSFVFTGITNFPCTNAQVFGGQNQMIVGDADCVYVSCGSGFSGNIEFDNIKTTSGWDSFFFLGSGLTITNRQCYGYSGNYPTNGISHGLSVSQSTIYDFNSVYIGTGSTNLNNSFTAAINVGAQAPVYLHGTHAVALGAANILPIVYGGNPVHGMWTETNTNGITAFMSEQYFFPETILQVFTNFLVLTGGGQGGPGNINLQYQYLNGGANGSFTNNSTHWVTNSDPNPVSQGGTWIAFGGSNFRYFSTNGFLGPYWITNASPAPPPNADYLRTTNFVVDQLGAITQTNFVQGQLYTNNLGRPISVRAMGFALPASVSGLAAIDLQVDQTQSGTFTMISRAGEATIVGTIANTNYGTLSGFIMTNGVYTFTNVSTGAGNSSGLLPGTGQFIFQ